MLHIPLTKIYYDYKTAFRRGFPIQDDQYGCYFITGFQGTGKTYYAVYLTNLNLKKFKKVKTNIKTLRVPNKVMFSKIDEISNDQDTDTLYIIDEIHKKFPKNSRPDRDFYSFLQQQRKRRNITILITQEWKEVPFWLRRPCKIMIVITKTRLLHFFGYRTACWGDGINMTFDKDEGEYICPPVKYHVFRNNRIFAEMYDTREIIDDL